MFIDTNKVSFFTAFQKRYAFAHFGITNNYSWALSGMLFGLIKRIEQGRYIIAINTLATTTTLGTVTIGGINATQLVKGVRGVGATEFWAAMVPTGTTATIVVTISANNPNRIGVLVWTATGMSSVTPVGTGTNTSSSSPHSTAAFATSNGGFVLMSSCDNGGAATFTESVSGGGKPAITENFDAVFGGSPTMVGALTGATDGTNITVTITGGTSANGGMAAVSF